MTPQLQQAIKMLQLSTLELQDEIQQALDSNMMLEEDHDDHHAQEESETKSINEERGHESLASDSTVNEQELSMGDKQEGLPDELPVDSNWDDVYDIAPATSVQSNDEDGQRGIDYGELQGESLQEHLLWQLQMSTLSEIDTQIGETLIDAIDHDGFIHAPLEEIYQGLLDQGLEIELDEVVAVLHSIQQYDPPGAAACSLQESLLLQIKALGLDSIEINLAQRLLKDYFDLLGNRDYLQIRRKMKISEEVLEGLIRLIQSLNPRPGSHFSSERLEYIVPDIFVRKHKDRWLVELNPDIAPKIRVNSLYASMIKKVNSNDSSTMKNHLQEARWFIKSLHSRNETLLKVSTSIIEHQRDFLDRGELGMKPMVLADIATELEMHESTISRTTTRKYMHTPRGIYELKYFFSSHVSTDGGGECSSTAIRAMIKSLVSNEPPKKPLSDNKIATMLAEEGIKVARRTIAKYRESMAIPPSNERKRLA